MKNKEEAKRIILANDLAGLGKVALANAIPIMACAGIESSILPTVILSSHTGGFKDVYIEEYTRGMEHFIKQWSTLDIKHEAMLTGYLKSKEQIDLLLKLKKDVLTKDSLLIVDPVMADNGTFYSGFDSDYAYKMKDLCKMADYIVPNITEAILLSDREIQESLSYDEGGIEKIFDTLLKQGSKNIIITGISFDEENLGVAFFDESIGKIDYIFTKKLPYKFFGTGDLFTAIISACVLRRKNLKDSIRFAVEWLDKVLRYTVEFGKNIQYGVYYEPFLKDFIEGIDDLEEKKHL